MGLRHLRYFVAVAHKKHFTQAAEELNLPRSVAEAPGREIALVSFVPHPPTRTILLAWHTEVYHTPATAACLAFLRNDIREHPWTS